MGSCNSFYGKRSSREMKAAAGRDVCSPTSTGAVTATPRLGDALSAGEQVPRRETQGRETGYHAALSEKRVLREQTWSPACGVHAPDSERSFLEKPARPRLCMEPKGTAPTGAGRSWGCKGHGGRNGEALVGAAEAQGQGLGNPGT